MRQNIIDEIDLIYNKILKDSKLDSNGIYWEILNYDNLKKEYYPMISENLYSGNAGVLLFLIEYYRIFKKPETLPIIKKSCDWLINHCEENVKCNK
ncbi:hypothetical protein [Pedobacter sp. NJ-S-72]